MSERSERTIDRGGDRATTVMVVEDDANIVDLLRSNLAVRGFEVVVSRNGLDAIDLLASASPDVALVDLGLPGIDGFELLRELRERSGMGLIVVSARRQEDDKVRALNLGADDYLTKPFGIDELLARIHATLRRSRPATTVHPAAVLHFGELAIDLDAQLVTVAGQAVKLTPDRVLPAARVRHQPRQAADPRRAAAPGVGPGLRHRDRVHPGVRAPPAGQAGAARRPAADRHRAPPGLPVRAGMSARGAFTVRSHRPSLC